MIFWEMERGWNDHSFAGAPNVVGGTLCHQAVEHLTVNSTRRSV
jgi:hypothetical protein